MNDNKLETRTIITSHSWSDSEHSYTLEHYSDGDIYLIVDNYYHSNEDTNPKYIILCEGWSILNKTKLVENSNEPIFTYTVTFGSSHVQFTYLAEAEIFIDKVNTLIEEIHNSTDKPNFGVIYKIKNGYEFKVRDNLTFRINKTWQSSYADIFIIYGKHTESDADFNISNGFTLYETIATSPNSYLSETDRFEKEYIIRWFTSGFEGYIYFPSSKEEAIMVYNCLNEIANKLKEKS